MTRWFRFYDDALNDPKILRLSDDVFRAWVSMLCVASKNKGVLPSTADLGFYLRIKPARVATLITQLVSAGLLDKDGETFAPHNWASRQYKAEDRGKDSYVYLIGVSWDGVLKIGFSKNPWARLGDIQTSHHEKISVLAVFRCKSHSEVDLHDILKDYRKNGEWFDIPNNLRETIRQSSEAKNSYEEMLVLLRSKLNGSLRSATTEQIQKQTTEQRQKDCADAPRDVRSELFDRGLKTLARLTGKGPDACRSFVGKCLKATSDDAVTVLGLIEEADRNRVVDPSAWIAARLKTGPPMSAKPLTEFQRKQQETNDVRAQLRNYANGGGSGGNSDRLLSNDPGQRPEDLRGGVGQTVLQIPRASGSGGD